MLRCKNLLEISLTGARFLDKQRSGASAYRKAEGVRASQENGNWKMALNQGTQWTQGQVWEQGDVHVSPHHKYFCEYFYQVFNQVFIKNLGKWGRVGVGHGEGLGVYMQGLLSTSRERRLWRGEFKNSFVNSTGRRRSRVVRKEGKEERGLPKGSICLRVRWLKRHLNISNT